MARRTNWDEFAEKKIITREAWRAVKRWARMDKYDQNRSCPFDNFSDCNWTEQSGLSGNRVCKAIFPLNANRVKSDIDPGATYVHCPCSELHPAHVRAMVNNFIAWGEGKWGRGKK